MAGIYLHIPFCKQACNYCDFHFSTKLVNKPKLLEAMHREIEMRSHQEKVETVYFGGGTPSILTDSELQSILELLHVHFDISQDAEITLEANPDDISIEKLESWRALGVNRLSIGIQSFKQEDLDFMNRAHNAQEAKQALHLAASVFQNITADLIYGSPNLTMEEWDQNIQIMLDTGIPHISAYALTVEEKTPLDHLISTGKIPPLDEHLAQTHFSHLVKRLKRAGFDHYEISNFGKPRFRSRHNSSYWQGKTYLGIGPAAHSFDGRTRSWNVSNNTKYMKSMALGILPSEKEELSVSDRYNEYIMTGMRTDYGVDLDYIEKYFGASGKQRFQRDVLSLLDSGAIRQEGTVFILNESARFRADGIASDLFWV